MNHGTVVREIVEYIEPTQRVLNWFDTGQCLARTPDGHWTRNTNIIVNVPAKP